MPIAIGTNPYIDLDRHFGDWRDEFARDGYYVVKGAVPAERAEQYRQRGFEWIEKWGLGFKRDDPSTWIKDKLPVVRKGGEWERLDPSKIDAYTNKECFITVWGTKHSCGTSDSE